MAATNSTTNLGLPQWVATDKPERTDFNTAMSDIDTNLNLVDNTVAAHLAESALDTHKPNPSARIYKTSSQSIASSTNVPITFNSVRFDNDNMFSIDEPTRLTCKTPGKYLIIGHIEFETSTTGKQAISIKINGTTLIAYQNDSAIGTYRGISLSTIYELELNDYVELIARQSGDTAIDVVLDPNVSPEFSIVRVG